MATLHHGGSYTAETTRPDIKGLIDSIINDRSHYVEKLSLNDLWGGFADNLRGEWVARIFFRGYLEKCDQVEIARLIQSDERVDRVTDFGIDTNTKLTYIDCYLLEGVI